MTPRLMRAVAAIAVVATSGVPASAAPRGTVLYEKSGVIQRSWLHVTQDVFRQVNHCAGTTVQGQDVNGVSAVVLDVSKYTGQHLAVALADDLKVVTWDYVIFYTHDCREVDFDKHDGGGQNEWGSQVLSYALEGTIPYRAAWMMIGHSGTTADVGRSLFSVFPYGQLSWKVTVTKVPSARPPRPRVCRLAPDAKGDATPDVAGRPEDQFDVLWADVAVDKEAVTVGIGLAALSDNVTLAPQRAYLVEFTLPNGKTVVVGAQQTSPSPAEYSDVFLGAFEWFAGTKDASGYHLLSVQNGNGVRGWYDTVSHEIRVSAQLARPKSGATISDVASFRPGVRLTGITGRAFEGGPVSEVPAHERDRATTKTAYVTGTPSCLTRVD